MESLLSKANIFLHLYSFLGFYDFYPSEVSIHLQKLGAGGRLVLKWSLEKGCKCVDLI
jgi:hypothetical protein